MKAEIVQFYRYLQTSGLTPDEISTTVIHYLSKECYADLQSVSTEIIMSLTTHLFHKTGNNKEQTRDLILMVANEVIDTMNRAEKGK